jgi:hypothetical protein
MSPPSPPRPQRLEVTIVFEPHRLQDHLLQTAYATLVPLPRRRRVVPSTSSTVPSIQPPQGGERSVS